MEHREPQELILLGLNANPKDGLDGPPFEDPDKLFELDQRNMWWRKYSDLTSSQSEFPRIFDQPGIAELSREPLTLFLLTSAGYHQRDPGVVVARPSISQIYRDVLRGLYDRDIERGTHAGQVQILFPEFFRALQVIGFAAWFYYRAEHDAKEVVEGTE
jgi:hypothetical protein